MAGERSFLLLLEGAANNHQWGRVFALVSLVISLSSQPAETPSPRQGGWTFAPSEQPMRRPLGTALRGSWLWEGCSGYLYYAGLKRSKSPCTAPWPCLEGDNRYLYKRL